MSDTVEEKVVFKPKKNWTKAEVAANREKWITALESGEYKQGKNALVRTDSQGERTYCCLGVACEVLGVERIPFPDDLFKVGDSKMGGLPTTEVTDAFGLTFRDGQHGGTNLAQLNDFKGATFTDIAAILRNPPPGLFCK